MGIPSGAIHVVVGGGLNGGEVWETGWWVAGDTITSNDQANAYALLWFQQLSANDASGAMTQTIAKLFGPYSNWSYVRVYVYSTSSTSATFIGEYTFTAKNGSLSAILPNQVALVVSLRTALAGRQHRGRMYLPAPSVTVQPNAQIASADATAVANAWATCFSDWNNSGDNGHVVVCSRVGGGALVAVTRVIVDSRLDIQRRRANKQSPSFTASAPLTS